MTPRILLVTVGSLGDLHPFIALALALRHAGAVVVIATAEEYRDKVLSTGIGFQPVRPSFAELQRRLGMDRARLTQAALTRSDFLLRTLLLPHLRDSYDDLLPLARDADLVLCSSLAFGARLAAEQCAVPWMAVVLQPFMFFSAHDPPEIPRVPWLRGALRAMGPRVARMVFKLLERGVRGQLAPIAELRRALRLPPAAHNPLFEGQFSSFGALALYSPLLGATQPDHPVGTVITGFATFDGAADAAPRLDDALEAFLAAGARPFVFTLGSLIVHHPGSFYAESVAAVRALGRRAVLLVGEDGAARHSGLGSADVHLCDYAPHSLLFPRSAAIVHQGGIGTLAQALRSGRPQLIVPFYADQPDNAARAVGLGVARRLAPARYTASAVRGALEDLERTPGYLAQALRVRRALLAENGAARAAQVVLERLRGLRRGSGSPRAAQGTMPPTGLRMPNGKSS